MDHYEVLAEIGKGRGKDGGGRELRVGVQDKKEGGWEGVGVEGAELWPNEREGEAAAGVGGEYFAGSEAPQHRPLLRSVRF